MNKIDEYLAVNGFANGTKDRYGRSLRRIAKVHGDLSDLDAMALSDWLDKQPWGSSTCWVAYCAVRGYVRWRFGNDHPALKLKIKRIESGPQRSLDFDQASELMASFDTRNRKGVRDLAICSLMLDTGLRAAEICALKIDNVNPKERTFSVIVKGGRWDYGAYSIYTGLYLESWLPIREKRLNADTKTLFISLAGKNTGGSLTTEGLKTTVRRWGEKIEIKLSPHDLRRTFAELSLKRGAPSRLVQIAGRWRDIKMVTRYTRNLKASDFDGYYPVAGVMEFEHKTSG